VRLSQKYSGWMQFVFQSYYQRTNELIEAVDSLAFLNLPERLANYLKNKAIVSKSTLIDATHMEIALDLHSSRVVISRLLKKLEKEGRIRMNRNKIELLDF
jgi:CRP/FNR family transcriptional regulator